MELNNITAFNTRQRIILVASEFDDQTLSAVAWLNSNQVDISCYQICAYKLNDDVLLDIKKILPVVDCEDFYVNVTKKGSLQKDRKKDISRRSLPKIDSLIEWKLVEPGDIITARHNVNSAVAKKGFGWSSVEHMLFRSIKKVEKH